MNSAKGSGAAALTRTAGFRALLAKLLYERGPDFALKVLVVTTTPGWEENRRAQICNIFQMKRGLRLFSVWRQRSSLKS
ncbi:hypothetical protein [Burkholderia sp. BCC1985]|uniref:hypothetical protein n=1 Tax=Burkholderia sp. BCC1985 TaxID=2817442 RepID=UPI002AB288FE|nr:hypothetical protein [Burkholderia sp. BCC1985]